MPVNASPHYEKAEVEYLNAQTTEQKIRCLKKMIALAPKHKGAENLRAQLKRRLARLKYAKEKEDKSGKRISVGIKKEAHQIVILGKTNSGKSTLLSSLTNAEPKVSEVQFTTKEPVVGMKNIETVNMQFIENPAIESEFYDKGLTNSADTILILIIDLEQIREIEKHLEKAKGKKIIVFNNKNNFDKRKISETLKSRKYDFAFMEDTEELLNKIFQSFNKIRVYTKEPGKKEKSPKPIILKPNSTVYDVAEKILHGFSKNVRETKIWGPSSKFPGQKVGLKHKLRDLDVVEFKTR